MSAWPQKQTFLGLTNERLFGVGFCASAICAGVEDFPIGQLCLNLRMVPLHQGRSPQNEGRQERRAPYHGAREIEIMTRTVGQPPTHAWKYAKSLGDVHKHYREPTARADEQQYSHPLGGLRSRPPAFMGKALGDITRALG